MNFYEIYKDRPITPIHSTYFGIWDKYINEAIRQGKLIRMHTTLGIAEFSPTHWKETGTKGEKVMLRPDEPMVLWYNYCRIIEKKTEDDKLEEFCKWVKL